MSYLGSDEFPFTCKLIYTSIYKYLYVSLHQSYVCILTGILPSHGRMIRFDTVADKNAAVRRAAEEFAAEDETRGMFGIGYW
jgi:hypothetical protein